MNTRRNSRCADTDEVDCEEVEQLLFEGDVLEEITPDSSFSSATTDTSIWAIWSQSPIDDVDTSFATTVDDGDFKLPPATEPSAPNFGFLKSTEECLEDVARTVMTIHNSYNHRSLHLLHQPIRTRISHVRSSGFIRPSASRPFAPHPYSGNHPSCPLYWKHNKSGEIVYVAAPAHLSYLRQVGNRWTYSLTGPWYSRSNPKMGDIHFSPSEDAGFDYWVYSIIDHEGVWCLIRLSQPHPMTGELVLQHLSLNSPPQWALSWPGIDVDFLYIS